MGKRTKLVELTPDLMAKLKNATGMFYDLQKLRIGSSNRATEQAAAANLDDDDKKFLELQGEKLNELEKDAKKEMARLLKGVPIWEQYLKDEVKGVAEGLACVLITTFDIRIADTVSKMWAYAGLATNPETGKAVRRVKGQKANYNPWLKAKLLKVMADCFIKAKSPQWYDIYVGSKHRRKSQMVPVCMGCNGTGSRVKVDREEETNPGIKKARKPTECWNCGGTGGPAPWGADDKHREADARRKMIKLFLIEFHSRWRTLEGLSVRPPYAEEKLGIKHHGPANGATNGSSAKISSHDIADQVMQARNEKPNRRKRGVEIKMLRKKRDERNVTKSTRKSRVETRARP